MAVTMLGSLAACGQSAPAAQSSASSSSSQAATEAKTEASKLSASTVQFKDTQWNSTVMYVYYWSSDNSKMVDWPGKQMKAVTGETSTYTYDLPDGVEFVIFTNGSTNQTRDIKLDGKNQQFRNTSETALMIPACASDVTSLTPSSPLSLSESRNLLQSS